MRYVHSFKFQNDIFAFPIEIAKSYMSALYVVN